MSNVVPEKVFLQGVLLHYFNMKKTAAKSNRILVEVYDEHGLAERTCQKWFARFKSGYFGLEDEELEALLDEDCCQTQEELTESLGLTQAAISKRLKSAGYIQKQVNWVPHELKTSNVERRFACPKCCWNAVTLKVILKILKIKYKQTFNIRIISEHLFTGEIVSLNQS